MITLITHMFNCFDFAMLRYHEAAPV